MRISYDAEVDAVYVRFDEGPSAVTTHRLTEDVAVNYAPDGHIVGIGALDAARHIFRRGAERTITIQNLIPVTES